MSTPITITAGNIQIGAKLNDTPTARAIVDALPVEAPGSRWGGEIYFAVPVEVNLEPGAREVLQAGELGYWPTGNAFCIFFGATPASNGEEIRAASPVNILGRIEGDLDNLWDVPDGAVISIRRASEDR